MVKGLPCTVGFVQGLRYDMIQYRKKGKERQWVRCFTHSKAICRKASRTQFTNDSSVKQDMNTKQYNRVNKSQGLAKDKKSECKHFQWVYCSSTACSLVINKQWHVWCEQREQCKLDMSYHKASDTNWRGGFLSGLKKKNLSVKSRHLHHNFPLLNVPTHAWVGSIIGWMMSPTTFLLSFNFIILKQLYDKAWTPADCNPEQPGKTGPSSYRELPRDSYKSQKVSASLQTNSCKG